MRRYLLPRSARGVESTAARSRHVLSNDALKLRFFGTLDVLRRWAFDHILIRPYTISERGKQRLLALRSKRHEAH